MGRREGLENVPIYICAESMQATSHSNSSTEGDDVLANEIAWQSSLKMKPSKETAKNISEQIGVTFTSQLLTFLVFTSIALLLLIKGTTFRTPLQSKTCLQLV